MMWWVHDLRDAVLIFNVQQGDTLRLIMDLVCILSPFSARRVDGG